MMQKSPYPYFGGKSVVASEIWKRIGNVPVYVEPFLGSAAVLLARPDVDPDTQLEHVNDKHGFIPNFWRAIQHDPEAVAHYADYPQFECDYHARHAWLVMQADDMQSRLEGDPDYYNAKIAGYWVWGMVLTIGGGFCSGLGPWQSIDGKLIKSNQTTNGIPRRRIHHSDTGPGILAERGKDLRGYLQSLAARFHRRVRVSCGDWLRLMKPGVCWGLNDNNPTLTGILLDPPYSHAEREKVYVEDHDIDADVRNWALEHGNNKYLRIAYCTYSDPDSELRFTAAGWSVYRWKTQGGYGNYGDGRGRANKVREALWFSPSCLGSHQQLGLF